MLVTRDGLRLWRMPRRYVTFRSPSHREEPSADRCAGVQCIKINPSWSKGYARKGAALHGSRQYDEAIAAYEEGLKLEDSPALKKGLKEVQDAKGME